jgi:hypothetical protein
MNPIIKPEDLFRTIKDGTYWNGERISEHLREEVSKPENEHLSHQVQAGSKDNLYYIYDNDVRLEVQDDLITLHNDREGTFSGGEVVEIRVKTINDIAAAYRLFRSMAIEPDESIDGYDEE